jgi:hypothetical protein
VKAAVAALTVLLASGCTTSITGTPVTAASGNGARGLIVEYFSELNDTAKQGPARQRDFLRRSQHPDFTDRLCDLGDLTLEIKPAMSTFRLDPKWVPEDTTKRPRGTVYVLGVSVSIRRQGALLAEQIGSQRLVVLDGKVYGFTPCPTR